MIVLHQPAARIVLCRHVMLVSHWQTTDTSPPLSCLCCLEFMPSVRLDRVFVFLMTILAMFNCIEYITPQHANRSTVQRLNVITGMSCKSSQTGPAVSTATAGMSLDDQVLLPDNYHEVVSHVTSRHLGSFDLQFKEFPWI
ncbi:hypothetical protein B0O80DRAFT_532274 [Mortierella sp. GBAus27b]|nr:hypothetical protein B0O80DRAFT_532274 [Mortierella sp. GBAus27b]